MLKCTIYTVGATEEMGGSVACKTLADAKRVRAQCEYPDGAITKLSCRADSLRALVVGAYNRERFVAEQTTVMPPAPRRRHDL